MFDLLLSLNIEQYKQIGESGVVSYGNDWKVLKPLLGAWPCLGTQPCYKPPADLCLTQTKRNNRVYCLENIRFIVLSRLKEGCPHAILPGGISSRKVLAVMSMVCKSPKRNNWGGTTLLKLMIIHQFIYIWPTSFTGYATVEVTWRVMPSGIRLITSGSNNQGMTPLPPH